MDTASQSPVETRVRRRVPCSLRLGGEEHRALILNLSHGGLFVRTNASARPGDHVEIQLAIDDSPAPVELEADVVWRRVANSTVSRMTDGGIGLRVDAAPEAYDRFVEELGGEPLPDGARAAAAAPGEAAVEAEVEAVRLTQFEVLLKLRGEPRSRSVEVDAEDGYDASRRALAGAGEGWEVLEIRRRTLCSDTEPPS